MLPLSVKLHGAESFVSY